VEILRALMDAADRDRVWDEATTEALHERNLVELDRLVAVAGVGEGLSRALREVPRLQGGREAIGECRALVAGSASTEALDRLERTFELLETCGAADRVWLDFGILCSFDYYTGVVLEAYSPGLGLPLGGGGRYDGLLAEFSSPSPAAGFALGLERLQVALSEQRRTIERPEPATLLGGEGLDAFRAAQVLRDQGERVVLAADELLLLAICLTYAFAADVLSGSAVLMALYAAYVLDMILFALRVARTTYLKKIADDPADITPTISMGITIDHAVAMTLPVLSGYIWEAYGFQWVFILAGAIALVGFFVCLRIRTPDRP
jgi:hypothetical protein